MLAEQLNYFETEKQVNSTLSDLDSYDSFIASKVFYQKRAQKILENNQLLAEQGIENVPLPVDVLSTSKKYLEEDDLSKKEILLEAVNEDNARLLAEAMRKSSWEYFPEIFERYNQDQNDLEINGIFLNETLFNGLSPFAHKEEQQIRVLEFVEHQIHLEIINKLRDNKNYEEVNIVTIKECPEYILEEYSQNHLPGKYGGYVPEINKLVIQKARINADGVYLEHIALPGIFFDHQSILEYLNLSGLKLDNNCTRLELRSKQFILDEHNSLLDIAKDLDEHVAKKNNLNIFLGEVASSPKDYSIVQQEAQFRQRESKEEVLELSRFLINLAKEDVDSGVAAYRLGQFLKKMLFSYVQENIAQADVIFDKPTQNLLILAEQLSQRGIIESSQKIVQKAFNRAPPAVFCGAGTCGIVAVNQFSKEAKAVKGLGLKGEVIKDTIRTCPKCKNSEVYYDSKGNKACAKCQNKEIKK